MYSIQLDDHVSILSVKLKSAYVWLLNGKLLGLNLAAWNLYQLITMTDFYSKDVCHTSSSLNRTSQEFTWRPDSYYHGNVYFK